MDTSIYDTTKDEILESLQSYKKIEKLDTVLFIIDEPMHNIILEAEKLLIMEYGDDAAILKKYSIDTIVKHLNKVGSTHTYSLAEKTFHRQINDPEKVKEKLDEEFSIWKNRLLKEITAVLKEKELSPELIEEKRRELKLEIDEAEKELEYVKEHFEELDVRISSFLTRPSPGVVVRFRINGVKKEGSFRLKNSIPNALFLKEKPDEVQPQNKLIRFLESAKHAFGDVYYKNLKDSH